MTPPKHSVLRNCKYCDKEFYAKAYEVGRGKGLFCSYSCSASTHRKTGSRTYASWAMMIQRCTNPNFPRFPEWGGSGITVAKEWLESFEAFFADMGERPAGKSLDRIKGDLGYFKGNCRWATPEEQSQNTKHVRLIEFRGEAKCIAEWARIVGLRYMTVISRINHGWTAEEALTIPADNRTRIKAIRKEHLYETTLSNPSDTNATSAVSTATGA
jgi:hypothetical protein